jgi:nucleoid-associated protein YgaU
MKKPSEEAVSMFLGLVVVVAAAGLIFSYFQKRKGTVDIPGTSQTLVKPTETTEGKTEKGVYVVKKGDNLWKIAEANYGSGYNWVDISKANNLSKPGVLAIGQKLTLPQVTEKIVKEKTQQKIEIGSYKVVRNDNLWKIAVRTYSDGYQWTKIWQSNKDKLRDPNKLEIGMELILPKLQ